MYDSIARSYARGEISKETALQMLWTMGATRTEIYFVMEAAEKMKEELKATT
jgi:hypothetical protein